MAIQRNLEYFHNWCLENALSYKLSYEESCDDMEVEIYSPAPQECYYKKHNGDLKLFIQHYEERNK